MPPALSLFLRKCTWLHYIQYALLPARPSLLTKYGGGNLTTTTCCVQWLSHWRAATTSWGGAWQAASHLSPLSLSRARVDGDNWPCGEAGHSSRQGMSRSETPPFYLKAPLYPLDTTGICPIYKPAAWSPSPTPTLNWPSAGICGLLKMYHKIQTLLFLCIIILWEVGWWHLCNLCFDVLLDYLTQYNIYLHDTWMALP